jgi:NAD(P)-dependent dehydrogenase (short-subunit alcohol dehydrogenase family)
MSQLENNVALITGAGAGIGRASALLFAQEGAKLALFSRTEQAVEETAELIRHNGGEVVVIVGDVANTEDQKRAISETLNTFGKLNCAFNNAGTEGEFGPLASLDETVYEQTLSTNLKGVWLSMKYQIPALMDNGGGAIVNMSSNISTLGLPGTSLYTASKAAVDGLTRCGAMDYAKHNIRVNAVAPGIVENTSMTSRLWTQDQLQGNRGNSPTGRLTTPVEIAEAAMWLCTDRAKHINGQILNIDGGSVMR